MTFGVAVLAVWLLLAGHAIATPPAGYTLNWSDEFNGTSLDTSAWYYRGDAKHKSVQLESNVSVDGGHLVLNLQPEPGGITVDGATYYASGAGVISKQSFGYGYYETRGILGDGVNDDGDSATDEGWHHAFWAMNAEQSPTRPGVVETTFPDSHRTEIDGFENPIGDPSSFTQHVISWDKGGVYPSPSPPPTGYNVGGWNTHGFLFTETGVDFYVNDIYQHSANYPASTYTHDFLHLWLTAISTNSMPSVEQSEARYDYFRYYAAGDEIVPEGVRELARYEFNGGSRENTAALTSGVRAADALLLHDPHADMGFSSWGNAYARSSIAPNTAEQAASLGQAHFEFSIDTSGGDKPIDLDQLAFDFGGSNADGTGFTSRLIVMSSLTGDQWLFDGTYDVPAGDGSQGSISFTPGLIDLSDPVFNAVNGVVSFTFHLFSDSDKGGDLVRIDNVALTGESYIANIPSPQASLALIGLGALMLPKRRR